MGLNAFDGRAAFWLSPDDRYRLTRWPNLTQHSHNLSHVRMIAVLGNAFGIDEGIVVDTHVRRVSQRLGLTKNEDPEKIEQDLMELVPREEWTDFSHLLIFHGRRVCVARKPKHDECALCELCPTCTLS